MAAMLEAPQAPLPEADRGPVDAVWALPFVTIETEHGPLAQRICTQRPSATVGRMPLVQALSVDPEMLSLLALDPQLATCDQKRALYFDTQTTGLGGEGAVAFLVGLGWFDEGGNFVLEQLLLDDPSQEPALLARLSEIIERSSCLVSFNGKSFDWPLLQSRCVMNRRPALQARPHLDLLHVSRRIHKRRLSRCRLLDLEAEVLGWERGEDDIPGAEIPPRYGHYLRTGDGEALRPVVDHNAWDVLTMAALVGLYGEPIDQLLAADLLGVAETLTRAKAYESAELVADRAIDLGEGIDGLSVRARLHRARGDKARALIDFEALSEQVDDPAVRLELAKLFEHHEKDFERALAVVSRGTGEDEQALERRISRLKRRSARTSTKSARTNQGKDST
jgi:uncharacterized protein YprB with RNaseH-like and TPR domain